MINSSGSAQERSPCDRDTSEDHAISALEQAEENQRAAHEEAHEERLRVRPRSGPSGSQRSVSIQVTTSTATAAATMAPPCATCRAVFRANNMECRRAQGEQPGQGTTNGTDADDHATINPKPKTQQPN
jgi:hypothetical protein